VRADPQDPTPRELARARKLFEAKEPRHLFYRVAIELIRLGRLGDTNISLAAALAVLLQTWNVSYYRFHGAFSEQHLRELEDVLADWTDVLEANAERQLGSLREDEQANVEALYGAFESVLGSTGASKALHLLAPRFFPLWDRPIAAGIGYPHAPRGSNAPRYWRFMQATRDQCDRLGGEAKYGPELLKRLDEFNFCRYTRGWI
jgi:hypothetical protein